MVELVVFLYIYRWGENYPIFEVFGIMEIIGIPSGLRNRF